MTDHPLLPLVPTSWHTIGPFFPQTFFHPQDNDLRVLSPGKTPGALGRAIILRGRVLEEGGRPCVNAVVEAWQADAAGRFRHAADPGWQDADPGFLGWGRAWTDKDGWYEFRTVLPGAYDDPSGPRAPHVNLVVLGSGIMRALLTTMFFAGNARNAADPVLGALPDETLRSRLLAKPERSADGANMFRFDIVLRGGAETPFFND